jgi:hypothetical protein
MTANGVKKEITVKASLKPEIMKTEITKKFEGQMGFNQHLLCEDAD